MFIFAARNMHSIKQKECYRRNFSAYSCWLRRDESFYKYITFHIFFHRHTHTSGWPHLSEVWKLLSKKKCCTNSIFGGEIQPLVLKTEDTNKHYIQRTVNWCWVAVLLYLYKGLRLFTFTSVNRKLIWACGSRNKFLSSNEGFYIVQTQITQQNLYNTWINKIIMILSRQPRTRTSSPLTTQIIITRITIIHLHNDQKQNKCTHSKEEMTL